jgi:hypothetical protein
VAASASADLILSQSKDGPEGSNVAASRSVLRDATPPQHEEREGKSVSAGGARPENLLQDADNVDSALGNLPTAAPFASHPRESGGPESAAGTLQTERLDLDARFRGHDTESVVPREGKGDARPENPPQDVENVESGLGNERAAEAAPPETPFHTPMVLTPAGWRRASIGMILNGVAAS